MKLVVLPGLDGTGCFSQGFKDAFPGDCQIISYPSNLVTYDEIQNWLMPKLPSERYAIVAESFSGPLALRIAAENPEKLKAIVLVASFAKSPRPFPQTMAKLFYAVPLSFGPAIDLVLRLAMGRNVPLAFKTTFAHTIKTIPRKTLAGRLAQVLKADYTDLLPEISVPGCYLQAKQDNLVPKSAAVPFANHWGNEAIRYVEGPHFLLQAQPQSCAEHITQFLDTLSGR